MKKADEGYQTIAFTTQRKLVADANYIGKQIPFIHSIAELNITGLRDKIKVYRNTSDNNLSLSIYILYCYVQAIAEQKQVQAVMKGNSALVIFDDVDIFFPIELADKSVRPYLIRAANLKTITEIGEELQAAQSKAYILSKEQAFFMCLPNWIRYLFYNRWMKQPRQRKTLFGTAYFSAIGAWRGNGLGIPIPLQSIGLFTGSVNAKLVKQGSEIIEQEYLNITISIDHSVNDGGAMARFIACLQKQVNEQIVNLK